MDMVIHDIDSNLDPLQGLIIDTANNTVASVASSTSTSKGRNLIGRAILTIFPPNDNDNWLIPETYFTDTSIVKGWVAQFEHAPTTGKLHIQAYVEFVNHKRPRFNNLSKLLQEISGTSANIRPTKRATSIARQCCINYCLKESDEDGCRVAGTKPFIWSQSQFPIAFCQKTWDERIAKTKANKKSSKEDKDEAQRLWIESKSRSTPWWSIVHESEESKALFFSCPNGKKYHESRNADIPRRIIKNIIILYGAGGTGKSTFAREWDSRADESKNERYYKRNPDDGNYWGGGITSYQHQRIIHFEEFDGKACTLSKYKEYTELNSEGPPVNIKNSGGFLNHETVIITSNHHPASWYRGVFDKDEKQWNPFHRRVTQVLFFPELKPDGSDNCPKSKEEYHFIDQTSTWKTDCKKWSSAKEHCNVHWPMNEPDQYDESTNTVYQPRFNK